MSSVFDTIFRNKTIKKADEIMDEGEARISCVLLSNTATTKSVQSNISSPRTYIYQK